MTQATITRSDDPHPTLTITLVPPIPYKGGEIAEFTLREPLAREMREAERLRTAEAPWASHLAYELKLIASIGGLSPAAADALPMTVVNHAATFLQELTEGDTDDEPADNAESEAPPEPMTLPIDPPITFLGVTYTDLDLREPLASEVRNARQLMRSAGSLFESRRAQMSLIAAVSGLPVPVIDQLRVSTLNAAGRVLGRFIVAGRKTGSN